MRYVNFGCGLVFHPKWENYDLFPNHPAVRQCSVTDLATEFQESTVDVFYIAHVLEHIDPRVVPSVLRDICRILRPGGILRVVVPDLEQIAKLYLHYLQKAVKGCEISGNRRDWMVVELIDQCVRHRSGGAMLDWWLEDPMPESSFVKARVGGDVLEHLDRPTKDAILKGRQAPLSEEEIGRFRSSGEPHLWMYDRYSLGQLLIQAGFCGINVMSAVQSAIPKFNGFFLDITESGTQRKPDSLYVEATLA